MFKFFTLAKESLPGLIQLGSISSLMYFSSHEMKKHREQLERTNPGFRAIAKPQYIPGCGTAWEWELIKIKAEEELPAPKNRP